MGSRRAVGDLGKPLKAGAIAELAIERVENAALLACDCLHGGKVIQLNPSSALGCRHYGNGPQVVLGPFVRPVSDGLNGDAGHGFAWVVEGLPSDVHTLAHP